MVDPAEPRPDQAVGCKEVAQLLGVETGTVNMWRYRRVMPEPSQTVGGRPAWRWREVRDWAISTGRLPGGED